MAQGQNTKLYRELSGRQFQRKNPHATEEIDKCIGKALGEFTDCLMNASACLRKKQTVGNTRQGGSVWFDRECREKKKSLRNFLFVFEKLVNSAISLPITALGRNTNNLLKPRNAISDLVKLTPNLAL